MALGPRRSSSPRSAHLRLHGGRRVLASSPSGGTTLPRRRSKEPDRPCLGAARRATASEAGIKAIDSAEKTDYTDNTAHGSTKSRDHSAAHVANWHMRLLELEVYATCSLIDQRVLGRHRRFAGEGVPTSPRPRGIPRGHQELHEGGDVRAPGGRGADHLVDLHTLIAKLPVAHRSAVFGRPDGRVASRARRLRGPIELDYPLMGVIKIEVPLRAGDFLESELVNRLSCCLVAERTVAAPGRDPRLARPPLSNLTWAEWAIRTAFVSHTVLRAAVKWPRMTA